MIEVSPETSDDLRGLRKCVVTQEHVSKLQSLIHRRAHRARAYHAEQNSQIDRLIMVAQDPTAARSRNRSISSSQLHVCNILLKM